MIDINNYSYTKDFAVDDPYIIAEYEDRLTGDYIRFTREQWGCNRNKQVYVVSGFIDCNDIDFAVPVDLSERWDIQKRPYEKAARVYDSYVPEGEAIPLF